MASSTRFFSRNFFARSRFLLTSAAICLAYLWITLRRWVLNGPVSSKPLTHYIPRGKRGQMRVAPCSADAYPHFNAIRDGRSDHGIVATLLGRCDRVILELSLVGFLSPLARKFDTYP